MGTIILSCDRRGIDNETTSDIVASLSGDRDRRFDVMNHDKK
jgi:hypothetical protein